MVLTKSDKLKPAQIDKIVKDTSVKISRYVAAYPEIFTTSSETKDGIEYLRAHIAGFAKNHKHKRRVADHTISTCAIARIADNQPVAAPALYPPTR